MSNPIDNNGKVIIGSCDVFVAEFTGEIPEDNIIEDDKNRAGNVKGGAVIEYSVSGNTIEDDKGRLKVNINNKEDVKLKTGMMTWIDRWIQSIIPTARIDTKTKPGHRIVKVGGLSKQNTKRYLFRHVHTYPDGRKLRVTVTGKNSGTISINFKNEDATTVDAEILAESLDDEGTLIIVDNQMSLEEAAEAQAAEPAKVEE